MKSIEVTIKLFATALLLNTVLVAESLAEEPKIRLFRYKNSSGVTVINNSIPAEFAQKGYEVITRSGEVVRIVDPAPTGDEIDRANREKNVLTQYEPLRRRYSSVEAIERAKQRKLQGINTNITILRGTIMNLTSSLDELTARAAQRERAGHKVPKTMLKQVKDIKAEITVSEKLLAKRQQEYADTDQKYENDKVIFTEGKQLEELRNKK